MKAGSGILLVSPSDEHAVIVEEFALEFGHEFLRLKRFEELLETNHRPSFLVLSHSAAADSGASLSELTQCAKQSMSNVFLTVLAEKELKKEDATFLRKCGANLVLLETELSTTSKLQFAASQILRSSFLPLKPTDLVSGTEVPFTVYHLLPMRKKFLPVIHSGDAVDPVRLERLGSVPEYYIRREDAFAFKTYVDAVSGQNPAATERRCRANYLALSADYLELALLLSDRSEVASYGEGQQLLVRCNKLCEDLLSNIGSYSEAWNVTNQSTVGEFGSLERAPAITTYCGLFGLCLDQQNVAQVMLSALFANVALLLAPPALTSALRTGRALSKEEEAWMAKVPETSLKLILDRKLSFEEKWRRILLSVNIQGQELEEHRFRAQIQMIQMARTFDERSCVRMGQERSDPRLVLGEITKFDHTTAPHQKQFARMLSEKLQHAALMP